MAKISNHLDKILGKIEDLDSLNLTILVKRLARERNLLETLLNTIQESVFIVDQEGITQYANQAAMTLVGLKPDDIGKLSIWKLIPGLINEFSSLKIDQDMVKFQEIELHYPSHKFVRVYQSTLNLDSTSPDKKDIAYFTFILSDITQDFISNQQLIENEKISSIFMLAAGVAHEIGNPLNSLNIHLQIMKRELDKLKQESAAKAKILNSVDTCLSEVTRLDGIIQHFLHAIKPVPPDFKSLNLYEVFIEVLTVLKGELDSLNIKVNVSYEKQLALINGDQNQIKQVLFNVLKNAMEAMEHQGTIQVLFTIDEDNIFLEIIDTGKGITKEDLPHVMEPYFSKKTTGTGLGLMITQRIMRAHGGSINIQSQENSGTIVTLRFPQNNRKLKTLEQKTEL